MRPYKAVSPLETIDKIRNILSDVGIITSEEPISKDQYHHSTRINVQNKGLEKYRLGTNGKGMTEPYSLASGYAELMERIQNRVFAFHAIKYLTPHISGKNKKLSYITDVMREKDISIKYRFYPDEVNYTICGRDEMFKHLHKYFPRTARYNNSEELKDVTYNLISAPFVNLSTNSTEQLPLYLILLSVSSTGMCAGNTKEEAILQGINEIFERYVLQLIYTENLIAPTISESYFKETEILLRLSRLKESRGIDFEIKDYSLGGKIPVIGLLLIDRAKNKYALRLGSHINPIVALERCYTEAFQGVKNYSSCYFNDIDFGAEINTTKEFNQNVLNGFGKFPITIFQSEKSQFYGFNFANTESFEDDLSQYIERIRELGSEVYVRDNSFLGFPSYYIFMPGMSDIDGRLTNMCKMVSDLNEQYFDVKYDYRINQLNENELADYANNLLSTDSENITLFPYSTHPHNTIDKEMLLAMIYSSLQRFKEAYQSLKSFIDRRVDSNIDINPYYQCLKNYLYLRSQGCSEKDTDKKLSKIYGDSLSNAVVDGMKSRENIFKNLKLPNCFECDRCPVSGSCDFISIAQFENKIQMYYNAYFSK